MDWVGEDSCVEKGSTWSSSQMVSSELGNGKVEEEVSSGDTCQTGPPPQESSLPGAARGQTSCEVHSQVAVVAELPSCWWKYPSDNVIWFPGKHLFHQISLPDR